jgi:hypothetical protein
MIITERPPNFDRILAAFPDADKPGVLFAYGEHVYNPSDVQIPDALVVHEGVHQVRQLRITPERWWEMYITETEFRYNEELLAHVAEYRARANGFRDRNYLAMLLSVTAIRLIAPLYNYQPPRSLAEAMRDLRRELERK